MPSNTDSKYFHIAIDGPVSAGKGTVSRLVAQRLGFLYIDTGAMYRVAALIAKRNGKAFKDEAGVVPLVEKAEIDMHDPTAEEEDGRLTTVLLNGEDVSWQIRTPEISLGSSDVSTIDKVRAILVEKQKEIASHNNIVMEGRDITYRVLPDAQLKIYLTASDVVRAKRRHFQLQTKGQDISFQEVFDDLVARDKQDSDLGNAGLQVVEDAWVVDTSDLSVEQVVDLIVAKVKMLRTE